MSAITTLHESVGHRRRGRTATTASLLAAGILVLGACGGGDDDESDSDAAATSTTAASGTATNATTAPVTTAAPATTTTTTLPEFEYVTEGAIVVVANASLINGAAGRLTTRLAAVGYTMTDATNSAESVNILEVTQIYYAPDDPGALAVADGLRLAFGGGDITVAEVTVPALTESGNLGEGTVLVLMGNDIADKTLEEMRNPGSTATTAAAATTTVADTATTTTIADTGDGTDGETGDDTEETTDGG